MTQTQPKPLTQAQIRRDAEATARYLTDDAIDTAWSHGIAMSQDDADAMQRREYHKRFTELGGIH